VAGLLKDNPEESTLWVQQGGLETLPSGPNEGFKARAGAGARGSSLGIGVAAGPSIRRLSRGTSKGGGMIGAGIRGLERGTPARGEGSGTGAGATPGLGRRGTAGWGADAVLGEGAGEIAGAESLGEGPGAGMSPGGIWGALGAVARGNTPTSLGEGPGVRNQILVSFMLREAESTFIKILTPGFTFPLPQEFPISSWWYVSCFKFVNRMLSKIYIVAGPFIV